MSEQGYLEADGDRWTAEQKRESANRRLQAARVSVLADLFGGIARDPEQEEYGKYLKEVEMRNTLRADVKKLSNQIISNCDSGDIQYKSAQIHNPTNGSVHDVTVIEDTGCRVNFISPAMAKLCNLTSHQTSPIEHSTMTGCFRSDQWTEVTWIGKNGKHGTHYFYIAPEQAPLDVLVGTQFMRDNRDVFSARPQIEPALLNV